MAQHENCKKYSDCTWRNDVGYCPDDCNQFKHKDEVIVIRCKDCKHYRESEHMERTGIKFCYRLMHPTENRHVGYNFAEDDFCSKGKKRNEI